MEFEKYLLRFSSCDLCGGPCQKYTLLCDYCFNDLPFFQYQHVANDLLNWPAIKQHLPQASFDQLICLAPHIWPFNDWISQFKYRRRFELSSLFAHLLSDLIQRLNLRKQLSKELLIISVPIHISRWQERGYNQGHLIAKALSKRLNIHYNGNLLVRQKSVSSQVGQSGAQRRKNLRNAFVFENSKLTKQPLPANIIIVDDVVTTGTTVNEICQLLRSQGVVNIIVVAVSLSLPI